MQRILRTQQKKSRKLPQYLMNPICCRGIAFQRAEKLESNKQQVKSRAILIRRGHEGEGQDGLYRLTTSPYTKAEGDYTVAFEDCGDATNFCYILESVFEDLGDFSADIVLLSIKELDVAVRSDTMKLIVVKKGQLELYAGQPLEEVESALTSLVKRS
ncbi:uncharacterized protein LOC130756928 [Actinidia eriantha]|uniref:uncharacterized protein LOC130756928 n=1 Tax=Actinidia eriantha TaxID=165200 RepID=UPI00258D0EB2|nr:uncharacterized protein LOC130756928 [Actinidia eriantha]